MDGSFGRGSVPSLVFLLFQPVRFRLLSGVPQKLRQIVHATISDYEKGNMLSDTIATVLNVKGDRVYTISPDAKAVDAVALMARKGIGAVVVISDGQLAGIVSAKDFGQRVVLERQPLENTKVGDIMTSPVITVSPTTTVAEAMALMTHNRIRHLPVVEKGELGGIVAMGDLARSVIAEQAFTIDQLQRYVGQRHPV